MHLLDVRHALLGIRWLCAGTMLSTCAHAYEPQSALAPATSDVFRIAAGVSTANSPNGSFLDTQAIRQEGQSKQLSPTDLSVSRIFTGLPGLSVPLDIPTPNRGPSVQLTLVYSWGGAPAYIGENWNLELGEITAAKLNELDDNILSAVQVRTIGLNTELIEKKDGTLAERSGKAVIAAKKIERADGNICWQITDRIGTRYEFGCSMESIAIGLDGTSSWLIDSITDSTGNQAKFSYKIEDNFPYPDKIEYGTSLAGQFLYRVKFIYTDSPKIIFDYKHGTRREKKKLLTSLEIFGGDAPFATYKFKYEHDQNEREQSWLHEISRKSINGDQNLAVVQLNYSVSPEYSPVKDLGGGPDWYTRPNEYWPGRWYTSDMCIKADFSGDGRTDIACYTANGGNWNVSVASDIGWQTTTWSGGPNGVSEKVSQYEPHYYLWKLNKQCVSGDFNGDGKTDIACHTRNGGNWEVGLSTGYGWKLETWGGGPNYPARWRWQDQDVKNDLNNYCIQGDFDGDGKADIACGDGSTNWNVWFSTGTGWQHKLLAGGMGLPAYPTGLDLARTCLTGDFDGDGRTDFACRPITRTNVFETPLIVSLSRGDHFETVTSNAGPTSNQALFAWSCVVADFNGDSRSDIACPQAGGTWNIGYFRTSDFEVSTTKTLYPTLFAGSRCYPSNYFGTSMWYLVCSEGGSSWSLNSVSTGDWKKIADIQGPAVGASDQVGKNCFFGDFNGDGVVDANCIDQNNPGGKVWKAMLSRTGGKLLTRATNWLGATENFEYGPVSQTPGSQVPFYIPVLKRRELNAGAHNEALIQQFNYEGAYYYAKRRQFRGFGRVALRESGSKESPVRLWDYRFLQSRNDENRDEDQFTGLTVGQISKYSLSDSQGDLLFEQRYKYTSKTAGGAKFSALLGVESVQCERGQCFSQVAVSYEYDEFANVVRQGESVSNQSGKKYAETIRRFKPNIEKHLLSLPYEETIYFGSDRSTMKLQAKSQLFYDSTNRDNLGFESPARGLVTTVRRFNSEKQNDFSETKYAYNALGHSIWQKDASGRQTQTSYDKSGQYKLLIIDKELHKTVFNYFGVNGLSLSDQPFGLLASVIAPDGVKAEQHYDGFGRLSRQNFADGSFLSQRYFADQESKWLRTVEHSTGLKITERLDGRGRVAATEKAYSSTTKTLSETSFDAYGQISEWRLPHAAQDHAKLIVTRKYDTLGRIIESKSSNGLAVLTCYRELKIAALFPGGRVHELMSDGVGGIVSLGQHNSTAQNCESTLEEKSRVTTSVRLGIAGRLEAVSIGNGGMSSRSYDLAGRLTEIKQAGQQPLRFNYDKLDNVLQINSKDGRSIKFTYNGIGQITSRLMMSEDDKTAQNVFFRYGKSVHNSGKLIFAGNKENSSSFAYDQYGRMNNIIRNIGPDSFTLKLDVDQLNRVVRAVYPMGETVQYEYNGLELNSIKLNSNPAIRFNAFDEFSRPRLITFPNGFSIKESISSGVSGECSVYAGTTCSIELAAGGKSVDSVSYEMNLFNSPIRITRAKALSKVTYDNFGQVIQIQSSQKSNSYKYDDYGNLRFKDNTRYSYQFSKNSPPVLFKVGDAQIQYSAAKQIVSSVNSRFAFNSDGSLALAKRGTHLRKYRRDAFGEIVETKKFLAMRKDPFPNYRCNYWPRNCRLSVRYNERTVAHRDSYSGLTTYYFTDGSGSPLRVFSEDGKGQTKFEYDLFGFQFKERVSGRLTNDRTPDIGLGGMRYDSEVGVIHTGNRSLDVKLGRFVQPDPLPLSTEFPAALNAYAFSGNNSFAMLDRTGLFSEYGDSSLYYSPYGSPSNAWNSPFGFAFTSLITSILLNSSGSIGRALDIAPDVARGSSVPEGLSPPNLHGISISSNIASLQGLALDPDRQLIAFVQRVKPGGAWDYKSFAPRGDLVKLQELADLGNFNYGAIGATLSAQFSDEALLRAAGWAQIGVSTLRAFENIVSGQLAKGSGGDIRFGVPWRGAPFGDQPRDQIMILMGIQYGRNRELLRQYESGQAQQPNEK